MNERRRPTHTVIVPAGQLPAVVAELIRTGSTFTCEQSSNASDVPVWHVGVLPEGVAALGRIFGPMVDVGTVGEWADIDRKAGEDHQ